MQNSRTRTGCFHPGRMLVAVIFALFISSGAHGQSKVGYVDMQRLLDNAPQIVTGNDRLRSEFAERDAQLRADEARLEQLRQQGDDASSQADALERRIRRTRETLRDELRRRSEEELDQRWREITEAVAAYARDENYDLIVSSPVFYASPSIDITDRVLARLRGTEEGAPEP